MSFFKEFTIGIIRVYLLLAVFLTPFQFTLFEWYTELLRLVFSPLISVIAVSLGMSPVLKDLSSDSELFLLLQCLLFTAAILINTWPLLLPIWKWRINDSQLRTILAYYLSLILLRYGMDKILLLQFPEPEPNLLYTPMGMLDRDILYWSVMGLGKGYTFFIGLSELIPGLLLLFKRTRTIGAFLAFIILLNVLAVNFGFDISVKMFSMMLTLIALYLSAPVFITLFDHFILAKSSATEHKNNEPEMFRKRHYLLKTVIIIVVFAELAFSYLFPSGYDSAAKMAPLAFEVVRTEQKYDPKRVFLHSDNYLIIQYNDDRTEAFPVYNFSKNKATSFIRINDHLSEVRLKRIQANDATLDCPDLVNGTLHLRRLDHRSLPSLRADFHLTVDQLIAQ